MFALLAGVAFLLHGFGIEPDKHPSLILWIGVTLLCWHVATGWAISLPGPGGAFVRRENPPA
jgi:hypothetical protein